MKHKLRWDPAGEKHDLYADKLQLKDNANNQKISPAWKLLFNVEYTLSFRESDFETRTRRVNERHARYVRIIPGIRMKRIVLNSVSCPPDMQRQWP